MKMVVIAYSAAIDPDVRANKEASYLRAPDEVTDILEDMPCESCRC